MKFHDLIERKTMGLNILDWLSQWYESECNGDWEHSFGIVIETLDNPGWHCVIDLRETQWETMDLKLTKESFPDDGWAFYKIEKQKFEISCDPKRLEHCLTYFKKWIEMAS